MIAVEAEGALQRNGFAMNALKIAALVSEMTDAAHRLNVVRQDPAVVKAAKQAWSDTKEASRSVAKLGIEVNLAWRRAGRPPQK